MLTLATRMAQAAGTSKVNPAKWTRVNGPFAATLSPVIPAIVGMGVPIAPGGRNGVASDSVRWPFVWTGTAEAEGKDAGDVPLATHPWMTSTTAINATLV